MNAELLHVSLRQSAVIVPDSTVSRRELSDDSGWLSANFSKLGYGLSEALLHALNGAGEAWNVAVLDALRDVIGVDKNWTPLVRGWNVPTGESFFNHIATFVNTAIRGKGTTLPCGHVIPPNSFPLERYNGCPFCGRPFVFGELSGYKQGSADKELVLWRRGDAEAFLLNLLQSKTALDATQLDSLRVLLRHFPLPEGAVISMRETRMIVIETLTADGKPDKAASFFDTPADILRYLWYRHTGFLQVLEPKTIVSRKARNGHHAFAKADKSASARLAAAAELRLKYTRTECAIVARWLNGLSMRADQMCAIMHPKRRIWVRFIRALRLSEWAKRPGFDLLAEVLDRFYRGDYPVWEGQVEAGRLRRDAKATFALLQRRPGAFARSLFANMLWFGREESIAAFSEVAGSVPARLLFTLAMYAELYFDPGAVRAVKPLGGTQKTIGANPLVRQLKRNEQKRMQEAVQDLCLDQMRKRYAASPAEGRIMYIDPALFRIPVAIGDRSETVQDIPAAIMGTRFAVEGESVRLFMQWGTGLSARHLDMDLSCHVAYDDHEAFCAYYSLAVTGCRHSGDIRVIPDQIGTAEYIEIDLAVLLRAGARFVTFTCNAYSAGSLSPNLVVGWMSSRFPMEISPVNGVAYNPSCVQHQVRVTGSLTKGLAFGVLDVAAGEIIWLEMRFPGQTIGRLNRSGVQAMLRKLESKLNIGELLRIKAEAQGMRIADTPMDADLAYTGAWARDQAAVTKLLVD